MTPEDPWTQQFEAFGRFWTGQRELAKRQLRQLAARNAQQQRDGFELAEQLLKAQREFTERVLAAARPVIEKRT